MTFSARVFCKHFDRETGKCGHDSNRGIFGRRKRCAILPGRERSCQLREEPERPKPQFKDAAVHGQCIDMSGNEWEVSAVTASDIVVTVKSPDGRSAQTNLPKEPFLNRLIGERDGPV